MRAAVAGPWYTTSAAAELDCPRAVRPAGPGRPWKRGIVRVGVGDDRHGDRPYVCGQKKYRVRVPGQGGGRFDLIVVRGAPWLSGGTGYQSNARRTEIYLRIL